MGGHEQRDEEEEEEEGGKEGAEGSGAFSCLSSLRTFIDNLQNIMFESLYEDCRLVALR